MKSTRFQFSNGTNTVDSIADTIEEATRGVSYGYTFTGVTSDMFYTHAAFAEEFLKEFVTKGPWTQKPWTTKPAIKDWVDTGFILTSGDENTPEFSFMFSDDGRVAIQYCAPLGADDRPSYDPDPLPTIRISMDKTIPRIVSDFANRLHGKAVNRHIANMEKVRQSNDRKQAQERTLSAIRTMFNRGEGDKRNPVRIGGSAKGWYGDAWVMDSDNVKITVDSIDSERALKILQFISELK